MMDIKAYLEEKKSVIDNYLNFLIPEKEGPLKTLYAAARYALLGKGKRIRPILTLAVTDMFDVEPSVALTPACSLELIHTYSLIHDDLPCMDNDDFRRGKPTLHKTFPEGLALLTGDFLLTYAFEILSTSSYISSEQKVKLIEILSQRSGSHGMIGGQALDIASLNDDIDLTALQQIHELKTGALMTAAIEFGGILGGAHQTQMDLLTRFGKALGLAFQIIDDVQDVTMSEQKHGKAIPSDVTNKKNTYVSLFGLEKSKQLAFQLCQSAITELQSLPFNSSSLIQLAEFVVLRDQ